MIANNRRMRLRTFDLNHAFLKVDLEEEIPHPTVKITVTPIFRVRYGLR